MSTQTFPPRYRFHRYWGRKPFQLIRSFILSHTQESEFTLDPMAGSGVSGLEALALGRKVILNDLNPLAHHLMTTMLTPVDLYALDKALERLSEEFAPLAREFYRTKCPVCLTVTEAAGFIIHEDRVDAVLVDCACSPGRLLQKPPTIQDLRHLYHFESLPLPSDLPDAEVPFGFETRKLLRKGISRFSQLYSRRNLIFCYHLHQAIRSMPDSTTRLMFMTAFLANLPQATKLIPETGGGPSWRIPTYWLPRCRRDLNVWRYFQQRYRKLRSAKADADQYTKNKAQQGVTYWIFNLDVRDLPQHLPERVTYAFVDPPYGGEGIQYFELSGFYNVWLNTHPIQWGKEIIFNPYRGNDWIRYQEQMSEAFDAIDTMMLPQGVISICCSKRNQAFLEAIKKAAGHQNWRFLSNHDYRPTHPSVIQSNCSRALQTEAVLSWAKCARRRLRPRS